MRALLLLMLSLASCGESAAPRDEDGDGVTILDGDCDDSPDGGAEIGPYAQETWYDGIDQNCDGSSDFDKDGDGFDWVGAGETDCWDDPDVIPEGFGAINGFAALSAGAVHPGAEDVHYDGIDANCDDLSDFDQDGDGYDTSNADHGPADGSGTDCYDVEADPYPGEEELLSPEDIHPGADDEWYDGTDANCDGAEDCDQDGDTWCVDEECDDTDPLLHPDGTVEEIWYNDVDENCDGNLYDKDGDGFESADFGGTDCWDDDAVVPPEYTGALTASEVYPGAEDVPYDGVDQDCDGASDFDVDGDGFDGGGGDDCDDADPDVHPGATETWYDGVDQGCEGDSDYDADADGFDGAEGGGADCDDTRAAVNPDANETCGTADDDNCDGAVDLEGAWGCTSWYRDADGDGYGSPSVSSRCWCEAPSGYGADNDDDCDDASSSDHPGAAETVGNSDDEDCEGGDTCYVDADDDGYRSADTSLLVRSSDVDCSDMGEGASTEPATDCDDASSSVNPGEADAAGDGVDQDCDGADG